MRLHLRSLLSTPTFSDKARTAKFLEYIVEQTLAGKSGRLKQYSIATEALGRDASFNPDLDPVVRLEAGKLRRALESYYLQAGTRDPVRISVPRGGYVPTFHFVSAAQEWHSGRLFENSGREPGLRLGMKNWDCDRLAVLPLRVQGSCSRSVAFSAGLLDQTIVELARYPDISVASIVADVCGVEPLTDPSKAGLRTQARFVLGGSARPSGDKLRLTFHLHDIEAGSIIWTECLDCDLSETSVIDSQEQIARRIAGAVADYYGVISHVLGLQSVYRAGPAPDVRAAIHRHRYLARTLSESVYRIARPDLEAATQYAPHHPMVWAALAHTTFYGHVLGFERDAQWMTLVDRYARRAFELDHRCSFGHVVMALQQLQGRSFDEVLETCVRISQCNPHAPSTKLSVGFFRALAGDWTAGIEMLNEALSGLLHPPGWAFRATYLDYYRRRLYGAALREIGKYHSPEHITPALLRAAALGQLGRIEEAGIAVSEVLRICPRFRDISAEYLRYLVPSDELQEHVMEGLRQAGLRP